MRSYRRGRIVEDTNLGRTKLRSFCRLRICLLYICMRAGFVCRLRICLLYICMRAGFVCRLRICLLYICMRAAGLVCAHQINFFNKTLFMFYLVCVLNVRAGCVFVRFKIRAWLFKKGGVLDGFRGWGVLSPPPLIVYICY